MNIYNFKISDWELEKLETKLEKYLVASNNSYVLKQYKLQGCSVLVYSSFKCVIQGKNAKLVMEKYFPFQLEKINGEQLSLLEDRKSIPNERELFNQYEYLIGSDEVGVGDYFGGLVVCSCLVKKSDLVKLEELKVTDSKKINDPKIIELAKKIKTFLTYDVKEITPLVYNQLYKMFNNSHVIKTFLHNEALVTLLEKYNRDDCFVILDEYAKPNSYLKYLQILERKKNARIDLSLPKAESSYLCVACASILARYYFLKQIKKLEKKLGQKIALGGWNKNVSETYLYLKEHFNKTEYNNFLKLHFKNEEKIK